ncbi:MipA/OmpV family protein [Teredinibacter franksiae]|uniref:MipA/OmpV family protein n=1 Tax=Teredinibacter franksiae TaxID=2761453 RepID=UPI001FE9CC56|nr:MipA/OmpV family protein [Teredinibacter franksiae]
MNIQIMKHYLHSILLCIVLLYTLPLFAADIASDVRTTGERESQNEDGGFFEVGLVVGHIHSPLESNQVDGEAGFGIDIDFFGEYRKHGFFIEATQGTQDGLNLGYTFWQNPTWQVDFLAGSMNGFYEPDMDLTIHEDDSDEEKNRKLYERNTFYMGTGLRVTHYVDDYVVQYRLLADTLEGNGVTSSLRVGRGWQYRNWNFFGIASAMYNSAKTNHMWFGVEEHEATNLYPAYSPGSTASLSLQLGFIRPLSEKWVLRGYIGFDQYPDEARKSPLMSDSNGNYALISFNRVF